MPPLVAFGRKWEIGSDDLVYPAIRNLFVRIPWLIATAVIYWQNREILEECDDGEFLKFYFFGVLGILSLMILADFLLIYNSTLGSIMEPQKRKYVPLCIYIKLTLYLGELGGNIWSTWAYAREKFNCTQAPDTTRMVLGLIICNWLLFLFFLVFWIRQFDPKGSPRDFDTPISEVTHTEFFDYLKQPPKMLRGSQWKRRMRCAFCGVCGEGKSKEISKIYQNASKCLAYMFSPYDLVQSDFIAGVWLKVFKTNIERKRIIERTYGGPKGYSLTSSVNFDPVSNSLKLPPSEDWNSIQSILHYYDYAFAIFTFSAALVTRRGKLLKSLCSKTQCCNCIPGRKYPLRVVNDNFCYVKTASIRTVIDDKDLIYASYDNSDFYCPFLVATDHPTKTIVIAIRGSFSAVDFLVDLSVTPNPMNVPGLPEEFKAHLGFLTVAKNIKSRLDQLEILQKLTKLYPDYRILLTGISLGAGISTILSMILRLEYENVKCLAFAAPGPAVSVDAAEYCNDFVTSIVYGDDIVPRLGIPTVAKALTQLQAILWESSTPKYQIQFGIGCSIFGLRKFRAKFRDNEKSRVVPEQNGEDDVSIADSAIEENISKETKSRRSLINSQVQLPKDEVGFSPEEVRQRVLEGFRQYPPGKVLHITQTPAFTSKRRKDQALAPPKWEVKWVDRTDFHEIVFSKRMLMDHMPFRMVRALRYLTKFSTKSIPVISNEPKPNA